MIEPIAQPLLETHGLSTWYPIRRGILARVQGHVQALTDVTLKIAPGETLGLVGESGCGKTTLGRTLMGLEKAVAGHALFKGVPIVEAGRSLRRPGRELQIIFQDPNSSLNPRRTVLDTVTEGMEEHGLMKGRREDEAARLLGDVGMDDSALNRYPFEFSGGQRQRINIARALSLRPSLIICDEAVSSLDVSVQAQVINLLMDLKEKYGHSYLFISHDLTTVRYLADRVAVMYLGRIVEEGTVEQVMERPLHPYTQALLSAVRVPGAEKKDRIVLSGEIPSPSRPPAGCPFHTRCPQVMDTCRTQFPEVREISGQKVGCHLYPE